MDWTMTFSRSELRREKKRERPMVRMEMGMAASMPCPTFSAR